MTKKVFDLVGKLKEDLKTAARHRDEGHYIFTYEMVGIRLREIENALHDSERPGHWVDDDMDEYGHVVCSECKSVEYSMTKYCPECGAKMDLEESND